MRKAIVTAGPTCEPLDEVRRLTNRSTGRLGIELANSLARRNVEVALLAGSGATWKGEVLPRRVILFTTTDNLAEMLEALSQEPFDAVYHVAAVSDFRFGKIYPAEAPGSFQIAGKGKLPTGSGRLMAELVPTPKILRSLRSAFPEAFLVGWKYEVEGSPESAIEKACLQLKTCRTDLSVANGPAYGSGFAVVSPDGSPVHAANREALYKILASRL